MNDKIIRKLYNMCKINVLQYLQYVKECRYEYK